MCAEFCKRNMHRNILKELRDMGDLHQSGTLLHLCAQWRFGALFSVAIQGVNNST